MHATMPRPFEMTAKRERPKKVAAEERWGDRTPKQLQELVDNLHALQVRLESHIAAMGQHQIKTIHIDSNKKDENSVRELNC